MERICWREVPTDQEPVEHPMKRPAALTRANSSHDYGAALQSAVSWLGNRYLLAEPVTRLRNEPGPYFNEPRRWHEYSPRFKVHVRTSAARRLG
jgi:hypothetical protein